MIEWLFAAMVALAPPGRVPSRESEEAGRARYLEIARDVETVVRDAKGNDSEAAMLIGIAFHESGFRLDVDQGTTKGGGVDSCLMQIRPRTAREAEELLDRRTCLRRGLMLARRSLGACASSPVADRLAAYASGSCSRGQPQSRALYALTRRVLGYRPSKRAAAKASPAATQAPAPTAATTDGGA